MRTASGNFTPDEMAEAVQYCHARGVKVYVTVNTLPRDDEMAQLPAYLSSLDEMGVDALILADLGVLMLAKRHAPHCEIHISTQTSIVNAQAACAWHELGASRVVLARELTLEQIAHIRKNTPETLELEAFVHGAMCMAYSGRCMLSQYLAGRDANRGNCAQPCRWGYSVVEQYRPGEYMPIEEDEHGTYIFNSKDMNMLPFVNRVAEAGIDSLKIEGRMKTALYVATVARTYRQAIDDYFESEEKYRERLPYYREEISKCTYRSYTTGFFFGAPGSDAQVYENNDYNKEYTYLGFPVEVMADGRLYMEQRNKFYVGDTVEVMHFNGESSYAKVLSITDTEGNAMESCPHPQQMLYVTLDCKADPLTILRIKREES
jgi:putative protease